MHDQTTAIENVDQSIVSNKLLRVDLDRSLQILKELPKSRHRALAITHLEAAIMRLGMDLKRLGELRPKSPPLTPQDLAKAAYHRYGSVTEFKNYRGDPMPAWEDLGPKIQSAWMAAAGDPGLPSDARPYPNSYDPTNTIVDPTADKLKL
jgi:hypothetical protein